MLNELKLSEREEVSFLVSVGVKAGASVEMDGTKTAPGTNTVAVARSYPSGSWAFPETTF